MPDPIAAWCLHLLPRGAGVQVAGVKGNRVQELMRQNQYVFNAVVELAGQFVVGNRPCQDSQAIHTYAYIHTYIHTYVHAYIHTYIHTYMHPAAPARIHRSLSCILKSALSCEFYLVTYTRTQTFENCCLWQASQQGSSYDTHVSSSSYDTHVSSSSVV